jgi:large subunit ribosomal protein L29
MKASELRELGADELAAKIRETRKELADLNLKLASKADVQKPARVRALRRDIARMLTVAGEKQKEAK